MLYLSHFVKKLISAYIFKYITVYLLRQIGFPKYFISVAHCCPPVLMDDITETWHDDCHIWKYYIITCYKMLAIFTYNDRHYVIFMKMTQYCYSPDWYAKCTIVIFATVCLMGALSCFSSIALCFVLGIILVSYLYILLSLNQIRKKVYNV